MLLSLVNQPAKIAKTRYKIIFLFILVAGLTSQAMGQFAGGSGTEADPYQIATAAQLDSVRHHLNSHFIQTADINLDIDPYNQDDGWDPIGRLNGSFVGSYDGGGHFIEGLFTTDLYQRIGLFYTLKGDIHNLKMTNVDIAVVNGGALAYEVIDASLSNIEVSGKVSGGIFAGGLMGSYTATSADSISDIKATITVESQQGAGGIAGTVSGNVTISNIVSSQEVAGRFAGGLAGVVNNFTGSITNSYVTGVMAGDYFAGGFIGYKQNGPLVIENSYSTADVTGQRNSGGITGLIENNSADEPISINQSYVTGSLDGNTTGGLIGEINGTSSTIDLSNSFWDTDSLGQIPSAGAGTVTGTDGTGLPITKMKRPDTYTDAGWDLNTVWEIKDPYAGNISYPRLRSIPEKTFPGLRDESVPVASNLTVDKEPKYKATLRAEYSFTDGDDDPDRSTIQWYRSDDAGGTNKQAIAGADSTVYTLTKDDIHKYFSVEVIPSDGYAEDDKMTFMVGEAQSPFDGGRGTEADPYQISTAEQLDYVHDFLDMHFVQTADIDLDVAPYNQGDGWEPIAQANGDEFSGNFDGNEYTVINLTSDRPTTDRVGLFGTNKGTLINIELVNVDIVGQSSVGALVGNNWPDATIESSTSSGNISAENTAGGLVGINQGAVQESSSSAFVEGRGSIGGLAGINGYGTGSIFSSSATGDVTGTNATANSLGGLVGSNRGSEVRYSYATGSVTGNTAIGGFVGSNRDDGALIEYSYASGEVTASGDEVSISSIGGFVGSNRFDGQIDQAFTFSKVTGDTESGFTGNNEATITNSFWNTMLSDQQNSDGGTGKTTVEMKTQSTFTDANWDFDSVWQMKDPQEGSISYPHLQNNTQDPAPGYRDESAPVAEDVDITGTPDPGSTLEVTYTYTDADGDDEQGTEIQWYQSNDETDENKTPITDATSETYTITDEDVCKFISVEVTPGDGYISGETVTASVGQGNAPFDGGCGTVKNPFQVATADQLDNVRDYLGSHFIQTADINLDVAPYNQGEGWEPILGECTREDDVTGDCMEYEYFSGSYNGNNYTIQNLFIDRPDGYPVGPDAVGVGLFARTDGATIENLSITEADITGRSDTGILSGYIQGGEFSKISVSGTLKGHQRVAGVSGAIAQSKVSQVYANVDVTNTENYAGGITGNASESIIQNSYTTGTVTSSNKNYVGGFIGSYNSFGNLQDNQIKNNYAAVQVNSSGDMVGGFSGHLNETNGDLDASGNFWDTDSSAQTTSAFGTGRSLFAMKTKSTFTNASWDFNSVWQIDEPQNGSLSYPYLRDHPQDPPPGYREENLPVAEDVEVTGEPEYKATLKASYTYTDADDDPETGTITQWYRSDDENGTNKEAIHGGGSLTYHLTKADVHKYISFEVIPDDGFARGDTVAIMVGETQSPFAGGRGTEANPYQIANAEQLNYVRDFLDVHFIQTDDIDLDVAPYNQGAGWKPLGNFSGVYDGDNHTISNLFIDSDDEHVGFFKSINNDTIGVKNLILQNLDVSGTGTYTGGLTGALISNLENVGISGDVSSTSSTVGGITGLLKKGTISKTRSSVNVTGNLRNTGGFIGLVELKDETEIKESSFTGTIKSNFTAGGFIGRNTKDDNPTVDDDLNLVISNSYFRGTIDADWAGGFIGTDDETFTLSNSYTVGTITSDDHAGGIVGYGGKQSSYDFENIYIAAGITGNTSGALFGGVENPIAVTNVYWNSDATTQTNTTGSGDLNGATDLSRFEMRTPDSFTDWDFDKTWKINEIESGYISYPYLAANETDSIPGRIKVEPPTFSNDYQQQSISATKAVYETEVVDEGTFSPISERGFTWSLTEDFSADTVMVPHTDDGLGVYADTLSNLPPYTTIYLRSYAKNPVGTTFGDVTSFQTEKQPLSIIGHFSPADKMYDGNSTAELDKESLRLDSVFVDHNVRIDSLILEFADPNVGSNIETTITSAELSGDDTEKYLLSLDSVATSKADIRPRPITITALPQSVEYGDPPAVLTYSVTSGSLVEGESLSGGLARTGDATVGDYTITKGTLSASSNYEVTYLSAPFIISPKTLTVAADTTLEKSYGDNDPALTYDASGFAYQEDESILTGSLTREKGESPGTYAIKQGNLSASDNYTIDYTGADFIIIGNPPEVTSIFPASDTTNVAVDTQLEIVFDDKITLADEQQISIKDESNSNIPLSAFVEFDTLRITPSTELENLITYTVTMDAGVVESETGGVNKKQMWSFKTQPAAPKLSFPSQDEEGISIAPQLAWNSGYEDGQYRIKVSSDESFSSVITDTLVATQSATLRNLDTNATYYWQVRVEDNSNASPWSPIRAFTTRLSSEEDVVDEQIVFGGSGDEGSSGNGGQDFEAFDYRLVGLPGSSTTPVDELFEGEYGRDWKVFEDDGGEENFLIEHSSDDPLSFTAGQGYWVLSKNPVTIKGTVPSVSISENDTYSITLQAGWNIISNPFNRAADWDQIQEFNNYSTTLFDYEGSFSTATKMAPFSAYYVYNDTGSEFELAIPYTSLDKRSSGRDKSFGKKSAAQRVAVTIANQDRDIQSKIHITYPEGDSLRRKADRHHPPMELSKFGASFIKEEQKGRQKLYQKLGDVYAEDRKHYQVVIKSTERQHIHWTPELKGLGNSAGVLVVDSKEGRMHILQQDEEYSFMTEVGEKTFDLYVGSLNELDEIKETLIPAEFTLNQNYPNPFYPTTTIRFGLEEKGDVRLEVFDVLGRKVQTLVDESRSAGWHDVTFDARNLASGTYFYRLIIGQHIQTQKMVLIK